MLVSFSFFFFINYTQHIHAYTHYIQTSYYCRKNTYSYCNLYILTITLLFFCPSSLLHILTTLYSTRLPHWFLMLFVVFFSFLHYITFTITPFFFTYYLQQRSPSLFSYILLPIIYVDNPPFPIRQCTEKIQDNYNNNKKNHT